MGYLQGLVGLCAVLVGAALIGRVVAGFRNRPLRPLPSLWWAGVPAVAFLLQEWLGELAHAGAVELSPLLEPVLALGVALELVCGVACLLLVRRLLVAAHTVGRALADAVREQVAVGDPLGRAVRLAARTTAPDCARSRSGRARTTRLRLAGQARPPLRPRPRTAPKEESSWSCQEGLSDSPRSQSSLASVSERQAGIRCEATSPARLRACGPARSGSRRTCVSGPRLRRPSGEAGRRERRA